VQLCFAAPGSVRLADIVTNSSALQQLAERINISASDFNQVLNISVNTSKVVYMSVHNVFSPSCVTSHIYIKCSMYLQFKVTHNRPVGLKASVLRMNIQ